MISQCMTTAFAKALLDGVHHFTTDVFKIALYDTTASLGQDTTAYTTTGEIVATGYSAGGAILTNLGTASAGVTGYASFSTVTWSGAGVAASGALIYNSTAVGNPAVAVLSFGLPRYAVSGTFTLSFPTNDATNAIIRVKAV